MLFIQYTDFTFHGALHFHITQTWQNAHMEEMIILQLYEWKWQNTINDLRLCSWNYSFARHFFLLFALSLFCWGNVVGAGAYDDCVYCEHFQCIYFAWLYYSSPNILFLLFGYFNVRCAWLDEAYIIDDLMNTLFSLIRFLSLPSCPPRLFHCLPLFTLTQSMQPL